MMLLLLLLRYVCETSVKVLPVHIVVTGTHAENGCLGSGPGATEEVRVGRKWEGSPPELISDKEEAGVRIYGGTECDPDKTDRGVALLTPTFSDAAVLEPGCSIMRLFSTAETKISSFRVCASGAVSVVWV